MPFRTQEDGDATVEEEAERLLRGLEGAAHGADDDEVDFLGQGEGVLEVVGEGVALLVEAEAGERGIVEFIVLWFGC